MHISMEYKLLTVVVC